MNSAELDQITALTALTAPGQVRFGSTSSWKEASVARMETPVTDNYETTLEGLQMAVGVLAEGLADLAAARWPEGAKRIQPAVEMARQAEDVATLAKACEVLVRRAREIAS